MVGKALGRHAALAIRLRTASTRDVPVLELGIELVDAYACVLVSELCTSCSSFERTASPVCSNEGSSALERPVLGSEVAVSVDGGEQNKGHSQH